MLFYYLVDGSATLVSHIFLQKKNKKINCYISVGSVYLGLPVFLSRGHTTCVPRNASAKIKTIFKKTFCLNVRPTDKYWMQEKGKHTGTTKPHILDDDFNPRSHMPRKSPDIYHRWFNILGKNGVWPSVVRNEKLWRWAACPRKRRRENPVSWQTWQQTCRPDHAGTSSARKLPTGSLPLAHPVGGEIPAHVYEIEPFTAHSGQRFHPLQHLLCWCLWGSKM